jgi:hypothetical protein
MTMRRLAILALALFIAAGAEAQTKTALTGAELEAVLRQAGFEPEMGKMENSGEPFATMKAQGYYFTARLRECVVASCNLLMLYANFNLDRDVVDRDYVAVNAYNDQELYGRAYVFAKENKVGIDLVVDLHGGVSLDYVRLSAERFPGMIKSFVDHYREEMDR